MAQSRKIVILGAGYGGVHAAKLLNKKFKKDKNIEITLIDKNPYHTLMTELHEVAGGRVEEDSVKINLKKIFSATRVNSLTDKITKIDFKEQKLYSEDSSYEYDYLIIGAGSEPAFFGVEGVKENGFTIWSLDDALKIREHMINMFRKASSERNAAKRRRMLTFVVAGAGFTGIETIGEFAEFKKKLSREYDVDEKEVRLLVVEATNKILPILNDNMIDKASRYLNKVGVEIITQAAITKVEKDKIHLGDGREIETNTLVWTCGVQGVEFSAKLGLTMGKKGRVAVNEFMQSLDYENVYLVGDNEYFEEEGNKPTPQIVETALQTAETAVKNIIADMEDKKKEGFKSNYHGFMVSIGSRYAVATLAGKSLSGFIAMAMKHLVNMHYLFGVGGFNTVWAYIVHEFFDMKERRSMIGGHLSAKSHSFWLAILRVYVGVIWLLEGVKKVQDGWLKPENIFIVQTEGVTGASEKAGEAAQAAATTVTPLLAHPPEIYTWFMDKCIAPNAFFFQSMVVLAEIGIGLALIGGLFTFLASCASIFLSLNFIICAMAGKEILWYIFAGLALMGGAGRAFGLDYYVMPWLKQWWNKTTLARRTYLFIDTPNH